jgi:hypothetical protein
MGRPDRVEQRFCQWPRRVSVQNVDFDAHSTLICAQRVPLMRFARSRQVFANSRLVCNKEPPVSFAEKVVR